MKLSVVIPVYNVETYIRSCVDSVLNQTLTDIEVILVDDGSPDSSGMICDELAKHDKRVTVIHKKNAGVGAARNDGLAIATGEWIIFCDSDDWFETNALEKLVNVGEETGADIVFGDVNLVFGKRVQPVRFYNDEFIMETREDIDKLIAADFCKTYCYNPSPTGPAFGYGGPWNKIVKKKLIDDHHIKFDVRVRGIFDDIIYTAYIFAVANKVAYVHVPVYNYRQLSSSITHKYKPDLLEINTEIFNSWNEFLAIYGDQGQFEKPYYANVVRRLTTSLGQYFFHEKNKQPLQQKLKALKSLIKSEPYVSAVQKSDYKKLNNRFDQLIAKASKNHSSIQIYIIFQLSAIKNKVLKKR